MRGIRISSRYAKSLLSLCVEQGKVDAAYSDMMSVASTIKGSRDLGVLLNSPVVKPDKKVRILEAIFGKELSPITMAFITLLTNKGREGLLHEVAESFISQVKLHKNISSVSLISAARLDEATRASILSLAGTLTNGKVELTEKIDTDLIGGFILQAGDQQIDASIATEINQLKREFKKNPYVAEL